MTLKLINFSKHFFYNIKLKLVDFKLEFGYNSKEKSFGDEISPIIVDYGTLIKKMVQ